MDPVTALRQIAYYKDRNRHDPRRVMAYRNAADIIEGLDDAARQRHGQANSWQSLAGIGPKTAKVIAQAWSGREPDLLAELALTLRISVEGRSVPHCAGICICIRTGRTGPRRSRR
ncbi:hydrolase [Mycobacterium tuberculosis]|nr:hydrolase [Mycobacterium tuberculosis]